MWLHRLAEYAANSGDPNTQNAAFVVTNRRSGIGVNCLPRFVADLPERLVPPQKYDWIIHAEVSAIIDAGHSASGSTLYALWAACPSCAVAIVESGVARVVTLQATQDATPERWRAKVATGLEILRAGGVEVSLFAGKLDTSILFDGKELEL